MKHLYSNHSFSSTVTWISKAILLFGFTIVTTPSQAQIKSLVEKTLSKTEEIQTEDSFQLKYQAVEQELSKTKEELLSISQQLILVQNQSVNGDSIKQRQRKLKIDSLRQVVKGAPVLSLEDTLYYIYAPNGGMKAGQRADLIRQRLLTLAENSKVNPDSIYLLKEDALIEIMYKDLVIATVTDNDALWLNTTTEELAAQYRQIIIESLQKLQKENSLIEWLKRAGWFVLTFVILIALFVYIQKGFLWVKEKIVSQAKSKYKTISIKGYDIITGIRISRLFVLAANVVKFFLWLLVLTIGIPILFSIFPQTEDLAATLFSYILSPVKNIFADLMDYFPNLFTIIVIVLLIRYLIKGFRYLAKEIEMERLKLPGFYPDWAQPTFNIVKFLLYAFMIAMIYPYLPGSNSGVFQGVSVFVGLIVSLGSTAVIGNIIAGMVITYMRPFKIGDRIKLNETVGNVLEKTPFVTRIKTPKNEVVTIPNSFILSSQTVNYSVSARNFGLIIHSEVTIGYDAPWRKVHQLLIDAALSTPNVQTDPSPFVLETGLSDFYVVYQINAYIQDADLLAKIYSDLHQNIQDKFNQAGVEIMSPHYRAERDGNETTIPKGEKTEIEAQKEKNNH